MNTSSGMLQGLKLYYDNNASASYLVISSECPSQVLKYQALMIASNKISHIIPFEMKQNDDSYYFYYNITSKLPLDTFLKRRKLARNEFIGILSSIAGTAVNSAGYLLSAACFITDAAYIYINPVTLDVQLVYVPLERDCDVSGEFRNFVIDLVLNHAELDENNSDNFLQRILGFVKNEMFNIADFYLFLNKLDTRHAEEKSDVSSGEHSEDNHMDISNQSGKQGDKCSGNSAFKDACKDCGKESRTGSKLAGGLVSKERRLNVPLMAAGIVLQAVIALMFLASVKFLKQAGNSGLTTYAALVMIALVVDVLVFKRLFSLGLINAAEVQNETLPPGNMDSNIADLQSEPGFVNVSAPDYGNNNCTCTDTVDKGSCNTIMLSPGRREQPCLLGKHGLEMEEIIIDKPEFFIGRLEGQVDYISANNAVGKVHACIAAKENAFYLSDFNSVNGTFINNIKIESNKEYEIRNNDIIAFANSEYVFIKPQ